MDVAYCDRRLTTRARSNDAYAALRVDACLECTVLGPDFPALVFNASLCEARLIPPSPFGSCGITSTAPAPSDAFAAVGEGTSPLPEEYKHETFARARKCGSLGAALPFYRTSCIKCWMRSTSAWPTGFFAPPALPVAPYHRGRDSRAGQSLLSRLPRAWFITQNQQTHPGFGNAGFQRFMVY